MHAESGALGLDLEILRERLELGMKTARRPRAMAVLAVWVRAIPALEPGDEQGDLQASLWTDIRGCLRASDIAAIAGPGRFLVLLERADDGPFAVHVADQIVGALRARRTVSDRSFDLCASVGISVYPHDGADVEELLKSAETAAEAADLGGGNLFGFSSRALNEAATRRLRVERALVGAIGRGELHLCFQPQLDTRDGSLVGVEALLRFYNDKLGAVPPSEFIPVLEATGGIDEVGAWVLERACEQAASWARDAQGVRMGVNVSARQLATGDFGERVVAILERTRLDPRLLELELTESVLVDNAGSAREVLMALRQRGVRIAVDDFGTGYASLAYVRHFPMDTLKIDRAFVRGLPLDQEAAAITSAIAALAHSLKLETVAEGVETEAEEEFLHSLECYVVQGFLHARPMTTEALETWRRQRPWA
jgi:EAL domain-containing protein (putative c-di-GMP-specific phosphodiesterase class I)